MKWLKPLKSVYNQVNNFAARFSIRPFIFGSEKTGTKIGPEKTRKGSTMFSFAKKIVDRLEGNTGGSENETRDSYFGNCLQFNNHGYGLRVLKVEPNSIGFTQGLESWFDYVIRVNNHELPMMYPSLSHSHYRIGDDGTITYGGNETQEQVGMINYDLLLQEISAAAKNIKQITFDVWSAKGGVIRSVVIPLTESVDSIEKIGITLQSQHLTTATYVWRILATHQGSPGFQSQLIPYSDYIIGCDSTFDEDTHGKGLLSSGGETLLSRTIQNYYNYHFQRTQQDFIPITLYVYNHDYDILRPVTVNLNRSWGQGQNRGILGCDVAYGLLHRIPEVIGKFDNGSIIEDVLFENKQTYSYDSIPQTPLSDNSFVPSSVPPVPSSAPAPVVGASSHPPPPMASLTSPPPHRSIKKKYAPVNVSGLNDYMNEELEKSKQLDTSQKPHQSTDSLPPPPPPKTS